MHVLLSGSAPSAPKRFKNLSGACLRKPAQQIRKVRVTYYVSDNYFTYHVLRITTYSRIDMGTYFYVSRIYVLRIATYFSITYRIRLMKGIVLRKTHVVAHGTVPWDVLWDVPRDVPSEFPWDVSPMGNVPWKFSWPSHGTSHGNSHGTSHGSSHGTSHAKSYGNSHGTFHGASHGTSMGRPMGRPVGIPIKRPM